MNASAKRRVTWVALAGFVAALIYLVFFHVDGRDRRLTGTAEATVLRADAAHRAIDYAYRYRVDGRTYEGTALLSGWSVAVRRRAKACYDPADPARSMLKSPSETCGVGAP